MTDRFVTQIPDLVDAAANDVLTFDGSKWVGASAGGTATTLTFAASNTTPTIKQTQAASGGGALMQLITQAAATGSVASGGHMALTMGSDDPTGSVNPAQPVQLYVGHATGPNPDPVMASEYWSIAFLKHLPGEVAALTMGGGDNLVGHNCAGVEISCSAQNPSMNIATDSAQISLIVSPSLGASVPNEVTVAQTGTDLANEAAWAFTTGVKHVTGGDASCIQLHNTTDAIGTGQLRWLDVFEGGVRQFDIRPNPGLTGAILGGPSGSYIYLGTGLEMATAVRASGGINMQVSSTMIWFNNSVSFGVRFNISGTDWALSATPSITSFKVNYEDTATASATGSALTLSGQNATGTTSIGGDTIVQPGTGTTRYGSTQILGSVVNGALSFTPSNGVNTLTAAQSSASIINCIAGATGAVTVTSAMPPTAGRLVFLRNNTSQTVTFQWSSGGGVTVATNTSALIYADGTNAVKIMAGT